MTSGNPIASSPNRLKLGVFGLNVSGGCAMTSAADTLKIEWQESVRIARAAEAAGIEALVPVARWRGFGGATNFNHRSFETLTWAAGLAAATERIGIFATVHTPTVHPVRAAKEIATIDHISGGRFALNIVAGWNEPEIRMFGVSQREHDQRYALPTNSRPC
jgi:dimethylsulfone monooxygenase